MMPRPAAITVSEVNRYVKGMLDQAPVLRNIRVMGEISNARRYDSGHFYFSLKDAAASIAAVSFASDMARLSFIPQNGDKVEARGHITLYEKDGRYQMVVQHMEKSGSGSLFEAFEALKEKLKAEGLFDPALRKPIPAFPRKIGIVTSPNGAALQDVLKVKLQRDPSASLILAPSLVQGERAADAIIHSLQRLDRMAEVDLILLVRGGGSIEDLWPFNEERVARAVFAAQTPIITGVGHDTDFTMVDFVSDLRAATPTHAAQLGIPERKLRMEKVSSLMQGLKLHIQRQMERSKERLAYGSMRLENASPKAKLEAQQSLLCDRMTRCRMLLDQQVAIMKIRLEKLSKSLELQSPEKPLDKGYALITSPEGTLIHSVAQLQPADAVQIQLRDGARLAKIMEES